eukprot:1278551-Pleurochrysis_carterae.AAC.1
MFIVASPHYRLGGISRFGWTMTCKWGHPVATFPSDGGDNTSRVVGHKFYKSVSAACAAVNKNSLVYGEIEY